MYKVI